MAMMVLPKWSIFRIEQTRWMLKSSVCGAQATGAISRTRRGAQANLAASADLLILMLLAAAAAHRHDRPVPAQRSNDRHAPTPHLQRASLLLYPKLQ